MSTQVAFYEQWRDLLRSWGFMVHEAANWRTRDAEPKTAYAPGKLYVEHHDASSKLSGNWGALAYILQNNLANVVTARDGQIMLCAAGVQWHAGVGAWGDIPANGANPRSLGNEVCNSGSEAYPEAQTRAIIATEAAWAIVSGRDASRVVGHKEWAMPRGRKSDPSIDMNQRRADVARFIPAGGDEVVSEQDKKDIAAAVWGYGVAEANGIGPAPAFAWLQHAAIQATGAASGLKQRIGYAVTEITGGSQEADAVLAEMYANLRTVLSLVTAQAAAPGSGVDPKAVAAELLPTLSGLIKTMSAADRAALVAEISKATNDEDDRRDRDGDPKTGVLPGAS